jgi:hypothetical protein
LPEFEAERDAAEEVKRQAIPVILASPWAPLPGGATAKKILVEPYGRAHFQVGIKKFNLDDLYVRFSASRTPHRRDDRKNGVLISNFSYLGGSSFVVMRQRFLAEFDALWFDCMNGDSRETGKRTPKDEPDPSVFSTEYNREGIRRRQA